MFLLNRQIGVGDSKYVIVFDPGCPGQMAVKWLLLLLLFYETDILCRKNVRMPFWMWKLQCVRPF